MTLLKTAFILTYEVNDYNQYGKYFLSHFSSKPTKEQLSKLISSDEDIQKLLDRGACEGYQLTEVKEGEKLKISY